MSVVIALGMLFAILYALIGLLVFVFGYSEWDDYKDSYDPSRQELAEWSRWAALNAHLWPMVLVISLVQAREEMK